LVVLTEHAAMPATISTPNNFAFIEVSPIGVARNSATALVSKDS
jgi:hypothetical protein